MTRVIAFFVYENFQLLDAAGPISAFEIAGRLEGPDIYSLKVVSKSGGLVLSSSGVALPTWPLTEIGAVDTLIAVGGEGAHQAMHCPETLVLIQAQNRTARRLCSVCSGSFILANAGVLDGLAATTHWSLSGCAG